MLVISTDKQSYQFEVNMRSRFLDISIYGTTLVKIAIIFFRNMLFMREAFEREFDGGEKSFLSSNTNNYITYRNRSIIAERLVLMETAYFRLVEKQ